VHLAAYQATVPSASASESVADPARAGLVELARVTDGNRSQKFRWSSEEASNGSFNGVGKKDAVGG